MERGDTGLGRDAYGQPRHQRDRRGYGPGPYPSDDGYPASAEYEEDDAAGPGGPVDVEDDDYGQLLRRPGEMPPRQQRLRQPGRPHPGQPGRIPPNAGPVNGGPVNGAMPGSAMPAGAHPGGHPNGGMAHGPTPRGGPPNSGPPNSGPPNGGPPSGGIPQGGPPGGGPGPGRQYRLPNGRRVPPAGDRLYRPPGPSAPGGTSGRHHGPGPAGQDQHGGNRSRPASAPGAPVPGGHIPGAPVPGGHTPGAPVPGGHIPGGPVPGGPVPGGHTPGGPVPGGPVPGGHTPGGPVPGSHTPGSHTPGSHIPGTHAPGGHVPGAHMPGGPAGPAPVGSPYGGPQGEPPGPQGPVIRQREAAVPEARAGGPAQPVASIAPDGLEAFARDLRALRAKANLEYPEMAELSHYEMKTLAAAAGGLRLPTLPVAVAFVRACDGNVAEWEERWQKLAEKLTTDAARKRRNDGEEHAEPPEPADAPTALEPPPLKTAAPQPPEADGGEVYVITSARPRQPGW